MGRKSSPHDKLLKNAFEKDLRRLSNSAGEIRQSYAKEKLDPLYTLHIKISLK